MLQQQHSILPPIGSKPQHLVVGSSNGPASPPVSLSKDSLMGPSAAFDALGGAGGALYPKAPGSEREDLLRKQWASIEADPGLDPVEKAKRKRSLILASSAGGTPSNTPSSSFGSSIQQSGGSAFMGSSVSPLAPPFYPTSDTVQSVIGECSPFIKSVSSSVGLCSEGYIFITSPNLGWLARERGIGAPLASQPIVRILLRMKMGWKHFMLAWNGGSKSGGELELCLGILLC